MLIELTETELEELKDLKEIFCDCYVNDKKVICFDIISEMLTIKKDTNELNHDDKTLLKEQLLDSNDWLVSLNCKTEVIGKLIRYFE